MESMMNQALNSKRVAILAKDAFNAKLLEELQEGRHSGQHA
jgi:hypothetical protein